MRIYPTLTDIFFNGTPHGRIKAIYRDRFTRPERLADFKLAIAAGDVSLKNLSSSDFHKLCEMGIYSGETAIKSRKPRISKPVLISEHVEPDLTFPMLKVEIQEPVIEHRPLPLEWIEAALESEQTWKRRHMGEKLTPPPRSRIKSEVVLPMTIGWHVWS